MMAYQPHDWSWIPQVGKQLGDTLSQIPAAIQLSNGIKQGQIQNPHIYAEVSKQIDAIPDAQFSQLTGMDKASAKAYLTPKSEPVGDYVLKTSKFMAALAPAFEQQAASQKQAAIGGAVTQAAALGPSVDNPLIGEKTKGMTPEQATDWAMNNMNQISTPTAKTVGTLDTRVAERLPASATMEQAKASPAYAAALGPVQQRERQTVAGIVGQPNQTQLGSYAAMAAAGLDPNANKLAFEVIPKSMTEYQKGMLDNKIKEIKERAARYAAAKDEKTRNEYKLPQIMDDYTGIKNRVTFLEDEIIKLTTESALTTEPAMNKDDPKIMEKKAEIANLQEFAKALQKAMVERAKAEGQYALGGGIDKADFNTVIEVAKKIGIPTTDPNFRQKLQAALQGKVDQGVVDEAINQLRGVHGSNQDTSGAGGGAGTATITDEEIDRAIQGSDSAFQDQYAATATDPAARAKAREAIRAYLQDNPQLR